MTDVNYARLKSPIKHIANIISDELSNVQSNHAQNAAGIAKVANKLFSTDYEDAKKALNHIINEHDRIYLVMIDSIESYDTKDKVLNAIALSLIETALKFYRDLNNDGILVKVAFPSEIFSRLVPQNREKMIGRILSIRWKYRDLFSLIAKRYWYFINHNTYVNEELSEFENAKDFLYRHFPKKITTSNSGIEYDTFDYILRHTQKKPRQVINMFNSILTISAENKGYPPFQINQDHVKRGIHAILNDLAIGSLNMYEQMHPEITEFIRSVFTAQTQCMKLKGVEKIMIKGSHICQTLSIPQKKQVLFECGILGLDINRKTSPRDKIIVESLFEYLTGDTLPLASDSTLVVHPMYYRLLRTNLNTDVSIFPVDKRKAV